MSNKQGLTVSQISVKLEIPPSTVRYYIGEYSKFIDRKPVEGSKTVLYVGQSLGVLSDIRKYQKEGKNKAEILNELEQKYQPTVQIVDGSVTGSQGDKLQVSNKVQNAMAVQQQAFLQNAVGTLQSQVEYQAKLIQQFQEIAKSQAELIDKLSADNAQLKNKRSLMDKLFNK